MPLAGHANAEAAVLRAAVLADVEVRQDLDARDDPSRVPVAEGLFLAEVGLLQHAVGAKPDLELVGERLEVDVAAAALDAPRA